MNIQGLFKRNMPVFVIGGLTMVVFLLIIISAQKNPIQTDTNLIKVEKEELAAPHTYTQGPFNAPVNIVEFADFGCPACKAFHSLMQQIMTDYPDSVSWSFRHFPLPQHKNADKASIAAQAAGEQDMFWEYAKVLYENQGKFDEDSIVGYADLIGLDINKFKQDIKNSTYQDLVEQDELFGKQIGINATPTFFLNGNQLNLQNYDDLRVEIEKALAANSIDPERTSEVIEEEQKNELQDKIIEEVDNRFDTLVIKYTDTGFSPQNTQAHAGQMVRWENTTNKDITFVQLMPKFEELTQQFVIKAGENFEFRLRLREFGLYTYKADGDTTRASILINRMPPDLEQALPE